MTNAVLIIAMTIFMESAGEPTAGKEAVATVIHNRAIQRKLTPEDVCMEERQFTCWNNPKKLRAFDGEEWETSMKLAKLIVTKRFKPKATWDHFYNPKNAKPTWRKKLRNVERIGNHIFGALA